MVDRLPAAAWTWRLPVSRPLTLSTWSLAMPSLQEKNVRWNNYQPVRSPHPHPPPPPHQPPPLPQELERGQLCWVNLPYSHPYAEKGSASAFVPVVFPCDAVTRKKTCAQLCNCTNRKWRLWQGHLRSCCALFQTFEWKDSVFYLKTVHVFFCTDRTLSFLTGFLFKCSVRTSYDSMILIYFAKYYF